MDTLTNGLSQGDFTTLRVLSNGVMTDILALIGSDGGTATLIGAGAAVVTGTGSTRTITVDLSSYATTAAVNALLANYVLASAYNTAMAAKIDTLTAGSNITITGSGTSRTITAAGGSSLSLQLDGVTQAGATTLNFVGNNANFASNVLNISRMTWR